MCYALTHIFFHSQHRFPNEITVCNVTVRARPPQNVGSLFADLPADIISVIATHTSKRYIQKNSFPFSDDRFFFEAVGSIRDLCALRRISTKWARGMRYVLEREGERDLYRERERGEIEERTFLC